jgi:hypothetical protein
MNPQRAHARAMLATAMGIMCVSTLALLVVEKTAQQRFQVPRPRRGLALPGEGPPLVMRKP